MISFLLFGLGLGLIINGNEMHYAVLCSGSNGYMNYRHQADVCHAYHVLRAGGMPEENIIVMSVDDAATSPQNPFHGKLYNKPTFGDDDKEAIDVREGCKIDYSGKSVTKETFIAVLTGDESAVENLNGTGRVLKSSSTDNVFVNFVDHGGVKLIAFPNGKTMQANQLNSALKTMYKNEMYKNLVFYLESCESGSMFQNLLPSDLNIYALTAANAKESSWGTYCPPHDIVKGRHMQTCLGDLFSVNWMEETDKERSHRMIPFNISLERQYRVVKKETNKSHVMQFGDLTFLTDKIDTFEGDVADDSWEMEGFGDKHHHGRDHHHHFDHHRHLKLHSAVDSRDIRLHLAYHQYIGAESEEQRQSAYEKMNEELSLRQQYDTVFSKFKQHFLLESVGETNWKCYSNVIDFFQKTCNKPDEHDYVMKYYGLLHDACTTEAEEDIFEAISTLCV